MNKREFSAEERELRDVLVANDVAGFIKIMKNIDEIDGSSWARVLKGVPVGVGYPRTADGLADFAWALWECICAFGVHDDSLWGDDESSILFTPGISVQAFMHGMLYGCGEYGACHDFCGWMDDHADEVEHYFGVEVIALQDEDVGNFDVKLTYLFGGSDRKLLPAQFHDGYFTTQIYRECVARFCSSKKDVIDLIDEASLFTAEEPDDGSADLDQHAWLVDRSKLQSGFLARLPTVMAAVSAYQNAERQLDGFARFLTALVDKYNLGDRYPSTYVDTSDKAVYLLIERSSSEDPALPGKVFRWRVSETIFLNNDEERPDYSESIAGYSSDPDRVPLVTKDSQLKAQLDDWSYYRRAGRWNEPGDLLPSLERFFGDDWAVVGRDIGQHLRDHLGGEAK